MPGISMDLRIEELLEGLSAPRPTPAGGAAAALALAQGAALGLKVVRISGRKERRLPLDDTEETLSRLLERAVSLFDADCRAVDGRRESVEPLIRVPLDVLTLSRELLERLEAVLPDVKRSVVSDAAAAASLARAAVEISYWNVRNNVSWGTEPGRWRKELGAAEEHRIAAHRAFDAITDYVDQLLR